jgi:MFS family permease
VLGARVLDRLGAGARSAPRDALVAASADAENRGKAFGLEGAGDNLGAFLGPLLAVLLLGAFQIDIRWIFYLAVIPGALAFLMVLFVSEKPVEARSKATLDLSLHRFPGAYRRYLAATALFGVGNSSNAFLVLETQARGAALSTTILIYAGFNLVAALASYPAGALSDRIGRRNLIVLGFMVFLGTYLGFAARPGVPVIAFLFLLYGLFQGIYRSVGKALASDLAPEALRASGVGWYGATIGLSGLFASVVAGQLWDHVGHAAVFLYGAAFASLGGLSLLLLVRETAPNG